MLARLVTNDGSEVWVNPIHVRSIATKTGLLGGAKGTEIMLSGESFHGHRIFVSQDPAQAAHILNEAMPLSFPPELLEDEPRRTSGSDGTN